MNQAAFWTSGWLGLSSIGFYLFLAVWVGLSIWARNQQKLAVQETLRKLIDSGTALSPEVIDSLRRPKPRRAVADIRASIVRYRYWGLFLVALGIAVTLWAMRYTDTPFFGPMFLIVPGLFCLAHSIITQLTHE